MVKRIILIFGLLLVSQSAFALNRVDEIIEVFGFQNIENQKSEDLPLGYLANGKGGQWKPF